MQIAPLIAQARERIGEVYEGLDSLGERTPTPADVQLLRMKAQEAERMADQAQVAAMYVMSMFKNGPDAKNTKRLAALLPSDEA